MSHAGSPTKAIAVIWRMRGSCDNAFTTHDYTVFYEQIARDRLKVVMSLDADRMANLDLSDPNVRTERDVVLEERRMRIDGNPQSLMREQMDAALYLSHPYGRPVIGWPEEIRHIGRIEAQDYYVRHYSPNNCILIVAGDVTTDEVRNDAEATYGKVPARDLRPRPEYAQPARLGETRLTVYRDDVKVPVLVRLYRVPSYTEARPGEAEALAHQASRPARTRALFRRSFGFAFLDPPFDGILIEAPVRANLECGNRAIFQQAIDGRWMDVKILSDVFQSHDCRHGPAFLPFDANRPLRINIASLRREINSFPISIC